VPNFFYYDTNGQKHGVFNEQQLKAFAATGLINPQTPLETEGGHKGLAGQIPGLFAVAPSAFVQPTQAVPSYGGNAVQTETVPDYLIWSIITTLFCCLPLGVIGIIFSVLSKNDLKVGDYEGAAKKSHIAMNCNFGGLIVGVVFFIFALIIGFLEAL
jgi:hypothetical protein